MDRYFTIMIVPEREKGVHSIRIPHILFRAISFLIVASVFILGIFAYDYWKILREIHRNKHLTIENRQLKEQIQLFQMKINSLSDDLERVHIFEKKLRIITGLEDVDMTRHLKEEDKIPAEDAKDVEPSQSFYKPVQNDLYKNLDELKNFSDNEKYLDLKNLYEQKIATRFGLQTGYNYTKEWSLLTKQSFELASQFAEFDYKFSLIKDYVKSLEVGIHHLDSFLLDKDSFLKSTPSLLPTKGWITSYYGPRISPTAKRLRMHEGIDIGARPGTPIVATADGRVANAGVKPGFGYFVQVDHGYGVETFYAHAKKLFAKRGQVVKRGDLIAAIGNTGQSTGPHLHYEIRVNGTPVDPLYFLLDR